MTRKILGYSERILEVNGEYDYYGRSYQYDPIRESQRGTIATAAVILCQECRTMIKSMGGPGHRSLCLSCYPKVKLQDFAEGHAHQVFD